MIRCEPCKLIVAFNDDQTKLSSHNYWHHSSKQDVKKVFEDTIKTLQQLRERFDSEDWIGAYPHISKVSAQALFLEKYVTEYIGKSIE